MKISALSTSGHQNPPSREFCNSITLGSALPGLAGPFEDAKSAYDRRDYATVLQLLRPLADEGNARAQTLVGTLYGGGLGVPKDDAKAAQWYRKAAEQGHVDAQYLLGYVYQSGWGVAKDAATAMIWYRKAAAKGHARAQRALDHVAFEARRQGLAKKASRRYREAALQGDATGQYNLGFLYEKGLGVPQDYVEATKWYRLGANQGWPTAQAGLGRMYLNGHGVARDYARALKWFRKAAEQGNADGQFWLGELYQTA